MRYSLASAETSVCFDGSNDSDSHDFDVILSIFFAYSSCFSFISCWTEAIILSTKFTTFSSEEELHELVSSVVDCASASNDINTDRQIAVNTRVKLPDLDMSAWYHTLVNWFNWSCQFDDCSDKRIGVQQSSQMTFWFGSAYVSSCTATVVGLAFVMLRRFLVMNWHRPGTEAYVPVCLAILFLSCFVTSVASIMRLYMPWEALTH